MANGRFHVRAIYFISHTSPPILAAPAQGINILPPGKVFYQGKVVIKYEPRKNQILVNPDIAGLEAIVGNYMQISPGNSADIAIITPGGMQLLYRGIERVGVLKPHIAMRAAKGIAGFFVDFFSS